ncbi:MAG: SGNH/GDSL hydrolase family protein [Phycisphaera sp.]|nr:SGNH/GDSL hydrolase family protein [Phycisphaera sp.]
MLTRSTLVVLTMLLTLIAATAAPLHAADKKPNPYAPITDDPKLPRVMIIGDSISIGYTLDVREDLKGVANVHRPPTNCGPTTRGLEGIDAWLGDPDTPAGKWDVIHFNFGLHDLKYCDDKGTITDIDKGHQQVPVDQYAANLEKLVQRMEKTGAKLIWRNTTPVPEGAKGRVPADVAKYNEAAAAVMKKHHIPTHDLYGYAMPILKEIQLPANVHYNKDGYAKLGAEVARVIKEALNK